MFKRLRDIKHIILLFLLFSCMNEISAQANQRGLIIEGDSPSVSNSFNRIKSTNRSVDFDVITYAHHPERGAGNSIDVDFYDFYLYDYILISVNEGSFSETFLSNMTAYVQNGGRLFINYQSFPRFRYVYWIEETTNKMLNDLGIDDEIVYDSIRLSDPVYGSLLEVDDETRIINTSRKAIAKLKHTANTRSSQYKCLFNSGHYFYKNADLSEAKSILEFNSDSLMMPVAAFWTSGLGVFGIGSEEYSMSAASKSVGNSWELLWDKLNMKVDVPKANEIHKTVVQTAKNNANRKIEQQKKKQRIAEDRSRKLIEKQMEAEKFRLEKQFALYVASEKAKLEEFKFRTKKEQDQLKRELQTILKEMEKDDNGLSDQDISFAGSQVHVTTDSNLGSYSIGNKTKTESGTSDEGKSVNLEKRTSTDSQYNNKGAARSQTQRVKSNFKRAIVSASSSRSSASNARQKNINVDLSNVSNTNQLLINDVNNLFDPELRDKVESTIEDFNSNDKSSILLIEGHLDHYDKQVDNYLKSLRLANQVKQLYIRNGFSADKIILLGLGNAYTMGDQILVSELEPKSTDLTGYSYNSGELYSSDDYDLYRHKSKGITFRISLGTQPYKWNSKLVNKLGDFAVEQHGNERLMTGIAGIFDDPKFVFEIVDIISSWMLSPDILIYLDGVRLNQDEIMQLAPKYPEIQSYLRLVNQG